MASVEVATSPRKAFSLAINGGLKEVWAPGRCVKADILGSRGGEVVGLGDEDLVLLFISKRVLLVFAVNRR